MVPSNAWSRETRYALPTDAELSALPPLGPPAPMGEVDRHDDTGVHSLSELVDHRQTDPCGVDVDRRAGGASSPYPIGDPGDAVDDLRVGRSEREAFEVANEEVSLDPAPDLPVLGLGHAHRGRVSFLADVDADRGHGISRLLSARPQSLAAGHAPGQRTLDRRHNAHGSTSSSNARSTSSRPNGWVSASKNSHWYSCRYHHSPIDRRSSARKSGEIREHSEAGTL